jgi:predicted nucleic acid-binding protein
MPEASRIVTNTGPLLALIAATGDLSLLKSLYEKVLVPREVADEMRAGGRAGFGVQRFDEARWLSVNPEYLSVSPYLANTLDRGEAAVIQLALNENVDAVCIDETVGRRVAALNNLEVTGSIGVLLRARRQGLIPDIGAAIESMRRAGIWVGERVVNAALELEKR